jgi:hypothetical protein
VQELHEAARQTKTMARCPRRKHCPAFKANVAVAAIKGERPMSEKPVLRRGQGGPIARRELTGGFSSFRVRGGSLAIAA